MGNGDKPLFEIEIKTTHRDLRGNVTGEHITRTTELTWPELERYFIQHLRGAGFVIPAGYEEWERFAPEEDKEDWCEESGCKKEDCCDCRGDFEYHVEEEPQGGCQADWDEEKGLLRRLRDLYEDQAEEEIQGLKDWIARRISTVDLRGTWVDKD